MRTDSARFQAIRIDSSSCAGFGLLALVHSTRMGKGYRQPISAATMFYKRRAVPERFNFVRLPTAPASSGSTVRLLGLAK